MWQEIWAAFVSEFADIPDLGTMTRITLRLVLAAILGGCVAKFVAGYVWSVSDDIRLLMRRIAALV